MEPEAISPYISTPNQTNAQAHYLDNLPQNTTKDKTQPGFTLCTPVISIDEIHVNKRKRKKSKKRKHVQSSKSRSPSKKHSKSRSKKRRRKRKRKHSSNSRSPERKKRSNRCKNKMCVKHAETDSIPNLLVDKLEDPPCKNKLCAKHNKGSTSEAQVVDPNDDDLDSSSSESSSDDESESSEEDCNEISQINNPIVPRCRRQKTFIRRILEFLGLQRRNSKSQECSCSTCGGQERKNKFSESKKAVSTDRQRIAGCSKDEPKTPERSCSNECGCPYCPLKISEKLDLDNIMVPKECGDLISESIREVVCKEIEFRLKGLEDSIVEEERQFWATYIPRDRCPRCCSGQQCDLHGSLGCVPCFSSKYGGNKC